MFTFSMQRFSVVEPSSDYCESEILAKSGCCLLLFGVVGFRAVIFKNQKIQVLQIPAQIHNKYLVYMCKYGILIKNRTNWAQI